MQPRQRRQDALLQLLHHVLVQQHAPGRRRSTTSTRSPSSLQPGDQVGRLVRADAGAAHQVGRREAGEAAEPGDGQGALARRRRSRAVRCAPASPGAGGGSCARPAAAPGRRPASASPTIRAPRTAGPTSPSPARRGTAGPGPTGPARSRRSPAATTVPMISDVPTWKRTGSAVLDRPFHVGQAVQPDGQHARRRQVAGRRELLAADHVLMTDAGQVDRRPLAAMDFLDGLVVVLQRADAHRLAARLPFHLVADPQTARRDRAGDDGAVPLHDEGAVDGQAEPLAAPPRSSTCRQASAMAAFSSAMPAPGVGRRADDRGVFEEACPAPARGFPARRLRASSRPPGRTWSGR